MNGRQKKRQLAVTGPWLPMPLDFLRSRAAAELSPHGAKLLLDVLALLGPNAIRNGDLSLSPKRMSVRGWTSRQTLNAAVRELVEFGLLFQTRQGSRLDCSLYACALFPLDCDLGKLDVRPGSYRTNEWMRGGEFADVPSEAKKARWRQARKARPAKEKAAGKKTFDAPPRDEVPQKRPATGQSPVADSADPPILSRHGTKPPVFGVPIVPPRDTYIEVPSPRVPGAPPAGVRP